MSIESGHRTLAVLGLAALAAAGCVTNSLSHGDGGGDAGRGDGGVSTYSVGGAISGLMSSGVVLRNNGGDDLSVSANGSFPFGTLLADGSGYNLTVVTEPAREFCPGTNAS